MKNYFAQLFYTKLVNIQVENPSIQFETKKAYDCTASKASITILGLDFFLFYSNSRMNAAFTYYESNEMKIGRRKTLKSNLKLQWKRQSHFWRVWNFESFNYFPIRQARFWWTLLKLWKFKWKQKRYCALI